MYCTSYPSFDSETSHESSGHELLKSRYDFWIGCPAGGASGAAPQSASFSGLPHPVGQQTSQEYVGFGPAERNPGGGPYADAPAAAHWEDGENQRLKILDTEFVAPCAPMFDRYTRPSGFTPCR